MFPGAIQHLAEREERSRLISNFQWLNMCLFSLIKSGWDNLETGDAVLVVLCVRLQVVDVDVGQAREQQLQLLLVEDRDQPGM